MKKKVNIIVGGFFYSQRLCKALKKNGWEVTLFTTMPKSRFKELNAHEIRSFFWIEILYRLFSKLGFETRAGEWKMSALEKGILKTGLITSEDILIAWSGFAAGIFKLFPSPLKILIRDSAHIETQVEILEKEFSKRNFKFPNHAKTIAREKEEYQLANFILVPSEFSKQSFIEKGIPTQKLHKILLGNNLENPTSPTFPKNEQPPLRVFFFGNLTLQKGVLYLWEALQPYLKSKEVNFSCFGSLSSEVIQRAPQLQEHYRGIVPHSQMKEKFSNFDVFIFPTLQDGFGFTLLEAMSLGIVPIVSKNCGASEIISHQKNGLLFEAFSEKSISEQLDWCLQNRERLSVLRQNAFETAQIYSWERYEQNLSEWLLKLRGSKEIELENLKVS